MLAVAISQKSYFFPSDFDAGFAGLTSEAAGNAPHLREYSLRVYDVFPILWSCHCVGPFSHISQSLHHTLSPSPLPHVAPLSFSAVSALSSITSLSSLGVSAGCQSLEKERRAHLR